MPERLPPAPRERWDLFCKVIDNFGDAGVSWRLARQLAVEHGCAVRLWIDEPAALARIAPAVDAGRDDGEVSVRLLAAMPERAALPDVVVEMFGCGLPGAYVAAMQAAPQPPRWFVLEYLSAEAWVEGTHGLPSPPSGTHLPRRFWFPGFTPRTGGLLREDDLCARREAFRAAPAPRHALLDSLGVTTPEHGLVVSMFCYPGAPLEALLAAWATSERPIACLVPDGVAPDAITRFAGALPRPGAPFRTGTLAVHTVPFLPQARYDELLWSCDVNFVRGEDSFVRGQWAARPFVWHIYPQADAAHHGKLEAFLDRYVAGLDGPSARAVRDLWRAWNGSDPTIDLGRAWGDFAAHEHTVRAHARTWEAGLAKLPELATGLVEAARSTV